MGEKGSFGKQMDELRLQVGKGQLEGQVLVDQVYAHYQDSGVGPHGKPAAAFNHPRGGKAGYLSDTLTEKGAQYAKSLADSIEEGVPMDTRMIQVSESLAMEVATHAPLDFGFLRTSAHVTVTSDSHQVYDRPAVTPRLSQSELDALRAFGGGNQSGNHAG